MRPDSLSLGTDGGTGPQDLLLVQRALQGEGFAVDATLGRLSCVVRFVYRLNRSLGFNLPTEGLEDVVQQAYVAIWSRLGDYAGTSALETWVFGFCRNCLRSEFRRRLPRQQTRPVPRGLSEQCSELPAPEEQVSLAEGLEMLQEELEQLPPAEREIVELRHLREWSFERIARTKALPPSTVKDRCYKALDKIRIRLKRRDSCA